MENKNIMELIVSNYILKIFDELIANETFILVDEIMFIQSRFFTVTSKIFKITITEAKEATRNTILNLKYTPLELNYDSIVDDITHLGKSKIIKALEKLEKTAHVEKMLAITQQDYALAAKLRDVEKRMHTAIDIIKKEDQGPL